MRIVRTITVPVTVALCVAGSVLPVTASAAGAASPDVYVHASPDVYVHT